MKENDCMDEKGKKIMDVLKYIQQFFSEIAQVIIKIDDSMEKSGWKPEYGTTVTRDCSHSLDNPEQWLPYWNYRVYLKEKNSNLRKIVSFCYDSEHVDQPIIIAGLVEVKNKEFFREWKDYWSLWHLWIEDKNKSKKYDGTIYSRFDSDYMNHVKKARLFAYNLIDIKNENDIKNKISDKLIELT